MKILLVEPDTKRITGNIALLKWARWCEENSHEYQYIVGCEKPKFEPDKILMSCIFSYFSKVYEETIDFYLENTDATITVGGVFPTIMPEWFDKPKWREDTILNLPKRVKVHKGMCSIIEDLAPKFVSDKISLYASRGCVNKCAYCVVPKLEGDMKSFRSIKSQLELARKERPNLKQIILFDNNFTEHAYFDDIIQELYDFDLPVDIHGLHVESFDEHKAEQLNRLEWKSQGDGPPYIRFSFDKKRYAEDVKRAFLIHRKLKMKPEFFCYLLFGFNDKPEDFYWRLQYAQDIIDTHGGMIKFYPQRYEPLNSLKRNSYVGRHWDLPLLRGIIRRTTWLRGFIPITPQRTMLLKWYGTTFEEFLTKMRQMGGLEKNDIFEDFFIT